MVVESTIPPGIASFKHVIVKRPELEKFKLENWIKGKIGASGKYKGLGSGAFASAYEHAREGHVIKVGTSASSNPHEDVAVRYAKEATARAPGNPHLPRTEHISSVIADRGTVHIHHMERLYPLKDATPEELEHIHHHAFGVRAPVTPRDIMLKVHGMTQDLDSGFVQPKTPLQHAIMVGLHVKKKLNKKGRDVFSDTDNLSNYMYRKTHLGPQLVLTDPIASEKDLLT